MIFPLPCVSLPPSSSSPPDSPCRAVASTAARSWATGSASAPAPERLATACKTEVKNQLSAAGLNDGNYAACEAALVTCNAPAGASFCEWITTTGGKQACGLAYPPPAAP